MMNDNIFRALRPVKARLRRNRFLRGLAFGLLGGLAAALAVRLVSLWVPMEHKWMLTLLPVPAGAILCAAGNALRPVRARDAAVAADDAGLRERAVTALENAERETEICLLQRADACSALRGLDVKRIRPGSVKKILVASLCCCAALAALLAVHMPADRAAENRSALRRKLQEGSEQVARAAEEDGEHLSKEERAELRRLTAELNRDLAESRDEADALVALDRAEQRLEQLQMKTAGDAAAASAALAQAGEAGTGSGEQKNAEGDGRQTQASSGNGQPGAQSPAGGQQAAASAATASTAAAPKTASAMSALKTAVNPSLAQSARQGAGSAAKSGASAGSGNSGTAGTAAGQQAQSSAQGSGLGGSGAGNQGNQAGGGAGEGSTNLEQNGGGSSPGMHAAGTRNPRFKEEKYETIYDPERTEAARRDEITNQNRLGDEDSVQAETGPGKGRLGGDVPWGDVFGEYAETETRSAERENLTGQEREWVKEYFSKLTEQNEE